MKIKKKLTLDAMEEHLITEEDVQKELGLKMKSVRDILNGNAGTSRNNVIKICKLLKVSFAAMKPEVKS